MKSSLLWHLSRSFGYLTACGTEAREDVLSKLSSLQSRPWRFGPAPDLPWLFCFFQKIAMICLASSRASPTLTGAEDIFYEAHPNSMCLTWVGCIWQIILFWRMSHYSANLLGCSEVGLELFRPGLSLSPAKQSCRSQGTFSQRVSEAFTNEVATQLDYFGSWTF